MVAGCRTRATNGVILQECTTIPCTSKTELCRGCLTHTTSQHGEWPPTRATLGSASTLGSIKPGQMPSLSTRARTLCCWLMDSIPFLQAKPTHQSCKIAHCVTHLRHLYYHMDWNYTAPLYYLFLVLSMPPCRSRGHRAPACRVLCQGAPWAAGSGQGSWARPDEVTQGFHPSLICKKAAAQMTGRAAREAASSPMTQMPCRHCVRRTGGSVVHTCTSLIDLLSPLL